MRSLLFILCFYLPVYCYSQTIERKLIITDPGDSLLLKGDPTFDTAGNYCFSLKQDTSYYFLTNKEKLGPFHFIGSSSARLGSISYSENYNRPEAEWYYKNSYGTKVYGPVKGKLGDRNCAGYNMNDVAITLNYSGYDYYYINDKIVNKVLDSSGEKLRYEYSTWCKFNRKGDRLYYINKNRQYYLFFNSQHIDSSTTIFSELTLNDDGDYGYIKNDIPFINSNRIYIKWNNNIAIGKHIFRDLENIENVELAGDSNYLFTYTEDSINYINVNGKIYNNGYDKIVIPNLGKKGHFSFYTRSNYYLFKVVNGVRNTTPISKYGVRAIPLYISPTGNSLHIFATDDSVYIYQNDSLIFSPIVYEDDDNISWSNLSTEGLGYLDYYYDIWQKDNVVLTIKNIQYIFYKGKMSKPLFVTKPVDKKYPYFSVSGIAEYGYYALQQIDQDKFRLIINNKIYKTLIGVSKIIKSSCYFYSNQFIFYGVEGNSFYRYKIIL
ncbi:MAG: hypothetical protein JST70_00315 [Bacteroidetes bacterium]|nr:hypothetical protein [Bacteroidota bacterium]